MSRPGYPTRWDASATVTRPYQGVVSRLTSPNSGEEHTCDHHHGRPAAALQCARRAADEFNRRVESERRKIEWPKLTE